MGQHLTKNVGPLRPIDLSINALNYTYYSGSPDAAGMLTVHGSTAQLVGSVGAGWPGLARR